jgi:Ca2+-binding EF-hand superfamily protein
MSQKINIDKINLFRNEIENVFNAYSKENNGSISICKLNDLIKINNLNNKHPFINDAVESLTYKKKEENSEFITSDEFISFFDEELNDINSKEGLKKIFKVFCEGNEKSFSWIKLPLIAKELGDNILAQNLKKLIEQGKLFNKEINFEEFQEIMNNNYDKNLNSHNDSKEYEIKNHYKEKENKVKLKEESEDMSYLSSKNEDTKNSLEDGGGEKSNKRYHRRYRDTKNKPENNENGNNINNKTQTKYRKKK